MFKENTKLIKKNSAYLVAIIDYMFFSVSNVFMKLASVKNNFADKIFMYLCSILTLFIFSILWQKLLAKMDLNRAYLFKGTTLLWGLIFGNLIFNEQITINMIIGAIIALLGIIITFTGGETSE